MARFEIFAGPVLVGYSALENGDPPMGVAAGRFLPAAGYAALQPEVIAAREGSQVHLSLRVLAAGGLELACEGDVQIVDYSAELGAEALEVHVLGIEPALYVRLFPSHVAAYEAQRPQAE